MLRFREFLLLEYNEDKNWANHGDKITMRLKAQGVKDNHKEFWHKQIQDHDPTSNKEYASWISQKYASGGIRHHEDIGSRVGPALEIYHKHKLKKTLEAHGVPKDIGAIKNITHLEDSVDKLPSLHKNDNQKVNDSEVTRHDEEHWKIYTPHTEAASQKYGAGTRWCTASNNNNMFDYYHKKGPMHIYVPKKPKYPGEKYQGHRDTFSFMNEKDEPVDSIEVFKGRPSPHDEEHGINDKHITKALDDSHWEIRAAAARNPKATPEHITKALSDDDTDVRAAAARNPKATPEHITRALGDPSAFVRAAAIRNPKATPGHITKALGDRHWGVRAAAIRNPKATPGHITKALDDSIESVRIEAISHPKATPEHITKALSDDDTDVRAAAARNPKATPEHITRALGDPDSDVRKIARARKIEMAAKV